MADPAALSSDDLIDQELQARGKMRLGYDDLMKHLVFKSCVRFNTHADTDGESEGNGEISEQTKINHKGNGEISQEKLSSGATNNQETTEEKEDEKDEDDDDDEDEEESDWREEYRSKGYVEVEKDYYIWRAEREAWLAEEWAKLDFSGLTFADSDDELLKACTVPLGALPHRIRQPLMQEQEEDDSSDTVGGQGETGGCVNFVPIHGREKMEEEVDREIIAFLRRCLAMDPKPKFLKELDRYQWPWPAGEEEESDSEAEESDSEEEEDLHNSNNGEVDVNDSAAADSLI